MKHLFAITLFIISFIEINAQQKEIPILKYEQVEQKITEQKDKFLVVNFWSTTCAPCVKELPDFMAVYKNHQQNPNFNMLLVSLDRGKDLEKVKKFVDEKNLVADLVILDDIKRMNTWIPRYNADWQGEIPVTVFYKNGEKILFHNGELSKEELEKIISDNL